MALLNVEKSGPHHPDNLQLLLKTHNSQKNNANWQRFSIQEQIDYITAAVNLQSLLATRLDVEHVPSILDSLFERLKAVY